MKKLVKYELLKAYKRKSFIISVAFLGILLIALNYLSISENFWVKEDGTTVTGLAAIQMERNELQSSAGELTADKLQSVLESYQAARNNGENYIQDDGSKGTDMNNAAFGKYEQPVSGILNMMRECFAPAGETYSYYVTDKIRPADAGLFYESRMKKVSEYLNMDYSYGNYSEADKEYFTDKNDDIDTPFYYTYHTGWNKLLASSYAMLMAVAMVVCICLAPMFSSEYQTGADAILLSTKNGKSKLIFAKIVAAFILTTIVYFIGMAVCTITTFTIYGFNGWNCSLQIMNLLAPSNVNLLQTYLYVLLAGYCLCLLMQGITLMLSAKMTSPFPVIVSTFVLFFVPSFIPYSRSSRLFNNLLNLLPSNMAAAYTALTKYEVYHIFGLRISYPVMLIIVAILAAMITLPFAYKSFRKHQVA